MNCTVVHNAVSRNTLDGDIVRVVLFELVAGDGELCIIPYLVFVDVFACGIILYGYIEFAVL